MVRRAGVRALMGCVAALLLNSTSSSAQNVTLAWDPSSSPGVAGYTVYVGTASGRYTSSFNAGNATTYTVTGLVAGANYCFAVQAYNTAGQGSTLSNEACGTPIVQVSVSSFGPSVSLPAGAGIPISWTAWTQGGDGSALEFQFFRLNVTTGVWTVVQPYGSSNTYTWTPSPAEAGQYMMQVWVRKVGSTSLETWASAPSFWITDFTLATVSPDVATPSWPGQPITWRATVVGSTPVEYRFWRYNTGLGSWTLVRDYSTVNSYTWTPTAGQVGKYWIQVWARPVGSTADFQAWRNDVEFEIQAAQPGLNVGVGWNTPPPLDPGQSITYRAITSGGTGPFEYAFYRYNGTAGTWSLLRNWSTTSTAMWTPTSSDRGLNHVQLWVRQVGSSSLAGFRNGTDQMVSPIKSTWLSSSVSLPARAGTLVVWDAGSVGNSSSVEYKFWVYSVAAGTWTVSRDWNSSSTFNWVPAAGNYYIQVWTRTTGSGAPYEGWQGSGLVTILP